MADGDTPDAGDDFDRDDSLVPDAGAGKDPDRDQHPWLQRINSLITARPWAIVAVFLAVTVLFIGGLGAGGDQQAGTDQFTEELEEADALEDMEENFERGTRSTGGSSATLFIDEGNVLSKDSLLRMLEAQHRLETHDRLRVTSTTSPASLTAQQLDPDADSAEEKQRAVRRASPGQLRTAVNDADEAASLPVSTDFNRADPSASVAQLAVSYDTPPMADDSDRASLQFRTVDVVAGVDGYEPGENVVVFADAIIDQEVNQLLTDTAVLVFPAALLLIIFFLIVAYRDPIDLGLGIAALLMTLVWTFGFMGYANIPFSDSLVTVFPLLLAVGIDFGIHIINRYREERLAGAEITDAMDITVRQLSAAFLIVTLTTVISFMANLTSSLDQLQDFGIVAAVGMVFTFLIFGVFLPAGKVAFDGLREGTRFPTFGTRPLGREESILGRILPVGATAAKVAPAVVLVSALVIGGVGGAYGTGVDTEFSQEAFFPDEERIETLQVLPEPFAPSQYTFMSVLNYLEEDFDQGFVGSVTVYIEDRAVRSDVALEDIDRALQDPPEAFVSEERRADATSIVGVMESRAAADPEFAATVERYDTTNTGVPDRNVDTVYEELFDSPAEDEALGSLTRDRSATRIQYQLDADTDQTEATAAAETVADGMRMDAIPTGQLVVNQVVIDRITDSAITSLIVAFLLTAVFLMVSYRWLEGRAIYGLINLVPVLVTVGVLAGSMRYFGVPLTPFNAPILSVSIGLGVDYTVHFMHRFVDEYEGGRDVHEALRVTAQGTGGALTGSMLTTVCGLGVLYIAVIPLIAEFGLLLALGVLYAYLASILVLPATVVVWHYLETDLLAGVGDYITNR
ncbi:RND superfamily permease [Natronomonas pharaonis DSM 2160]|uniref:RND superfamily permease n=1 Tax=Natronomonas pharaonis (strain ATCC 35678 / DSM 2160 / CIP 103997 / JCM 8858 / NBRC 14720 / NCIMB 2260 / Gabara) TaxID=348780 RepID=A0A1U7EX31_NATPD|nr:MMPL family transporter [Natronomonas pharaonis]CAI49656.1 RND superfamily permease [Natronomonas pharaonis DSM 2160]